MGPAIAGPVNDVSKIKAGLKRKAKKYGKPNEPLVVAVLSLSSPENEDIESVLLGQLTWRIDPNDPTNGEWGRQEDGFWYRNGTPRSTKISAVMVGVGLLPWIVPRLWPRLWINPWADHPLPTGLPFPVGRPATNGIVSYQEASGTPDAIFGLPHDWPGPEAPFQGPGS